VGRSGRPPCLTPSTSTTLCMDPQTALREIKQTNDNYADDPETFEVDKESYKRVLREADDVGGPQLVDALTGRLVQDIHAASERPGPTAVRQHAVDLCERKGIEIPEGSELADDEPTGSDAGIGEDSL